METELVIDKTGGAKAQKFSQMTTEELRLRFWTFPEARKEYTKRFLAEQAIPKSG